MKYGPHIMIDMPGCNPDKVSDAKFIYQFLSELPSKIGMNKIAEPHLDLYTGIHSDWDGFSATIHIQESHITFHFFEWGYLFADIFSCKDFDEDLAIQEISKAFEADSHQPKFKDPDNPKAKAAREHLKGATTQIHKLARGLNFPPSLK